MVPEIRNATLMTENFSSNNGVRGQVAVQGHYCVLLVHWLGNKFSLSCTPATVLAEGWLSSGSFEVGWSPVGPHKAKGHQCVVPVFSR